MHLMATATHIRDNLVLSKAILAGQFSDDQETVNQIERIWKDLEPVLNAKAIDYCLTQYVQAELDFESPSKRGLGRVTEVIPRLGAFFRKPMSRISKEDLNELKTLIETQCLLGYLTHIFFCENEIVDVSHTDHEQIYTAWLPSIYSNDLGDMSEDMEQLFSLCSFRGKHGLKSFFDAHGMKAGFFQSDDMADVIILYYFAAGFILRETELKFIAETAEDSELENGAEKVWSWDIFEGQSNTPDVLEAKGKDLADAVYALSFLEVGTFIETLKDEDFLEEDEIDELKPVHELIVFLRVYATLQVFLKLTECSSDDTQLLIKALMTQLIEKSMASLNQIAEEGEDKRAAQVLIGAGLVNRQERGKIYSTLWEKDLENDGKEAFDEFGSEMCRLMGKKQNKQISDLAVLMALRTCKALNMEQLLEGKD